MTPAEREIDELDKALAVDGEWIWLRHVVGSSAATQQNIDVRCRAAVRGYEPKDLIASITQRQRRVILSPTQINRAQWPGGQVVATAQFQADPRIPSKNRGDRCIIVADGTNCAIETAAPIVIGETIIRIEMRIVG